MSPITLFLSWQQPNTRQWHVVGRLREVTNGYEFVYTKGVIAANEDGFQPLIAFPDLHRIYVAEDLFATFQNRVLSSARSEYGDLLNWLDLRPHEATPLLLLERTNGTRQTDALELFRLPEVDETGLLRANFFLRGLRHRDEGVQQAVLAMQPGDQIFLSLDVQNVRDPDAVLLHNQEDILGYGHLPRYLTPVVRPRLLEAPGAVRVTVAQVNPSPAPAQLRLLCHVEVQIPQDVHLFKEERYQSLQN